MTPDKSLADASRTPTESETRHPKKPQPPPMVVVVKGPWTFREEPFDAARESDPQK